MKLYITSDHAGFALKEYLVRALQDEAEVIDMGPHTLEPKDDYPDYVVPCARVVAEDPEARGIVIGGSGQGEAMAANRIRGVRASVFYGGSGDILTLSREHNNANILSLGARFLHEEEALAAVRVWIGANFSEDERHVRRIAKLDDIHD